MAYKPPFPSFLLKNKHTFRKQTFHFLSIDTFFSPSIFSFLPLKMHFLGFRFFSKKPKNLKMHILPLKSSFLMKPNSQSCCRKKVSLEMYPWNFEKVKGKNLRGGQKWGKMKNSPPVTFSP